MNLGNRKLTNVSVYVQFKTIIPIGQRFIKEVDLAMSNEFPGAAIFDALPETVPGPRDPIVTPLANAFQFSLGDSLVCLIQREMFALKWDSNISGEAPAPYPGHEALFRTANRILKLILASLSTASNQAITQLPVVGASVGYYNLLQCNQPPLPTCCSHDSAIYTDVQHGKRVSIAYNVAIDRENGLDAGFQFLEDFDSNNCAFSPRQWRLFLSAGQVMPTKEVDLSESLTRIHEATHRLLKEHFPAEIVSLILKEPS